MPFFTDMWKTFVIHFGYKGTEKFLFTMQMSEFLIFFYNRTSSDKLTITSLNYVNQPTNATVVSFIPEISPFT